MPADATTAKSVFLAALEKATPADRAAYLDEACAGNDALRRKVEGLLRAHDQPDGLLDRAAADHLAADGEVDLHFLGPTDRPDSLGRLGHYEILDVVGKGAMGIVLRAFDEKLHRVVAVKVLADALAGSKEARQRFVREARAAAAVSHDHVVGIYAVEDAGPVPYLVMQFVGGKTLQDKIDQGGPLPLAETLRIGLQIAEGLAAAQRHGLIHRDIKPANILLENGVERVKITDFGLARTAADAHLTASGFLVGTPAYMSPEQADGQPVDHRSDLFSLGSVLYAMCAGQPPLRAGSAMGVLRRVCDEAPRPLRDVNAAVPEWLAAVVAKLQAKRPADRYGSAAEVAAVLSQRLAELQSGTVLRPDPMRPERRPVLGWAAVVLLVAATAAIAWFAGKSRTDGRDEARNNQPAPPAAATVPAPQAGPVTLKPARTLKRHTAGVRTLAFSPDRTVLASGGLDHDIYLWDTATWEPRGPLEGSPGEVSGLAFAPNGRRLASVTPGNDDCRVRVWDVAAARPAGILGPAGEGMWAVAYSSDGRTVACGGWDRTLYLMDAATGNERVTIPDAASQFVRGLSFSADGRQIAAGGSGPTRVWEAATGKEVPTAEPLPLGMCPTFLPDGGLASWNHGEGRVILCDLPSGRVRAAWRAQAHLIDGMAVSKDGRFLASVGDDGVAHVWATADALEVATLVGHGGPILSAAFTPDGTRLATGGREDHSIHLWDLPAICRTRK
jgi:serine/threonine protein kinase